MANNIVPVTREEHQNVKIRTDAGIGYTEKVHVVPVVVNEFADVAANSPIVFLKDEKSDRFRPASMLGLRVEENLFYRDGEWVGTHIPMNLGRVPFSIKAIGDGKQVGAAIDMDSDLVGEEGSALFDENGKETEYFERVTRFLAQLFEGEVASQKFMETLEKQNLLREFRLLLEDVNGVKTELTGLWTPDNQALQNLPDDVALEMHKSGHLAATHVAIQSMAQIKRLVQLNNQKGGTLVRSINVDMIDPTKQDT
ncbi:SapC family protein [Kordiimonas aquimaris]|uniref:SapC family protein n=1 Tax=Kordiimonas aquimaris TaxID=707591 RepID=UPI0021D040BC|nr:SapC family protein [Kordiimonas aquimaris]